MLILQVSYSGQHQKLSNQNKENFRIQKFKTLKVGKRKDFSEVSLEQKKIMLNFNHDSKIKFFLLSLKEYTPVQPKIEGRN